MMADLFVVDNKLLSCALRTNILVLLILSFILYVCLFVCLSVCLSPSLSFSVCPCLSTYLSSFKEDLTNMILCKPSPFQEEQQILQFHLSSLEYVGGCSLRNLSALHWDQNEALPQFGEPHLLLPSGYGALFQRLAKGLDIVYDSKVGYAALHWSVSVLILSSSFSFPIYNFCVCGPFSHIITFHTR